MHTPRRISKRTLPNTFVLVSAVAVLLGCVGLLLTYKNTLSSVGSIFGTGALMSDVLPLYSGATWGSPKTYTLDLGTESLSGYRALSQTVRDVSDLTPIFLPFEQYYSQKLTDAGWKADFSLAAGGPGSEQAVYRKGNAFAVIAYTTQFKGNRVNEPVKCPCDITLSVFTGEKKIGGVARGEDGDPDSTVIVTESDTGKTLKAPIDQYVALEFTKQKWSVTLTPTGILVPQNPPAAFASAAGYYRAVNPGTVKLKAVSPNSTFETTIIVER